jgi:hypothetical protein
MSYINNTPYSSRLIYLDSRNSDKTDNNYKFVFSSDVETPYATKMILSIREVNIPNIMPNVITGVNDTIEILGTITGLHTYTFNQQYYNVKSFKSAFDAMSVTLGNDIVVTYDKYTLKLTFTSLVEDFTITTNTSMNRIGCATPETSSIGVLTLTNIMNFASEPYIFLKSSVVLRNINNLGETSNTFLRIPIGTVPYGNILYHEPQQPIEYLSQDTFLRQIQFQLKSNDGLDINLDNHSFQIVIQISYLYPNDAKIYKNPFEKGGLHKHPMDMLENEIKKILIKEEEKKEVKNE